MAMLTYLMRMAKSLIENKSIYLEKYVSYYYQKLYNLKVNNLI